MTDHFDKKNIKQYILIAGVLVLFFILALLGIYRSPLEFIFGIPCPLCGITRAFVSAFCGDFEAAFYYHPLWPVVALVVVFYFLAWLGAIRPSERIFGVVLSLFCILLILCFVWRHLSGSEIVRIDFNSSALYRFLHFFV